MMSDLMGGKKNKGHRGPVWGPVPGPTLRCGASRRDAAVGEAR